MDGNSKLGIKTGLENYILFQRYPFFRWPSWVEGGNTVSPGPLLNKTFNRWVCFSNMNAPHEIRIDTSGMVTPSNGRWALEFWVVHGQKIYRSQNFPSNCIIEKMPVSSAVTITWKEKPFTLKAAFTGARTLSEEVVCSIELLLSDSARGAAELLAVIRPYNNHTLGSVFAASFEGSSGLVRIDGKAVLKSETVQDFVVSGSGSGGDINPINKENSFSVSSADGMATIGLGFNIKKKSAPVILRIVLDDFDIDARTLNVPFDELDREFEKFASMRVREGVKISIPDTHFTNWFLSSKASALSLAESDFFHFENEFNFKNAYFFARALHRMGYLRNASKCIEKMRSHLLYKEKKPRFDNIINCCYFVSAIVDSFIYTRDTDYLNREFSFAMEISKAILRYTSQLKELDDVKENSLHSCVLDKALCYDFALIAHAYNSAAYFARCVGIFGDEKKFDSESHRIQQMILRHESYYEDEFFFLMMFAAYPFNLPFCREASASVLERAKDYFPDSLVKIKSLGIDAFSSIIMVHNMLLQGSPEALKIFAEVIKMAEGRYAIPEFLDPREKTGLWGSGASKICSSEIFSFLRGMIFVDSPERLSIFPIPVEEWFEPGREFSIENAPSRFGSINFRYTATPNELVFHFDVLPKFVPPEIAITLPYPMKLQKNDEFLLKKSFGNTYVINGWPAFIRFFRVS